MASWCCIVAEIYGRHQPPRETQIVALRALKYRVGGVYYQRGALAPRHYNVFAHQFMTSMYRGENFHPPILTQ